MGITRRRDHHAWDSRPVGAVAAGRAADLLPPRPGTLEDEAGFMTAQASARSRAPVARSAGAGESAVAKPLTSTTSPEEELAIAMPGTDRACPRYR